MFNVYVFDKLKEFGVRACGADHPPHKRHREPHMVKTLCEKIAAGSNLKTLRLEGFHDLSQVSRSTLTKMVTHLEELELSGRLTDQSFSRDDITTIVRGIGTTETSNLKKLKISIDMRSVDSQLVAQMATRVEDLELHFVNEEQVRAIFGDIATRMGKLRRMTLEKNCLFLHKLDADIAAIALNNLESFEFDYRSGHSYFTVHQTEKILHQAKKATTLQKLTIWVEGYTGYSDDPLNPLITEAKEIIPHLYIWRGGSA